MSVEEKLELAKILEDMGIDPARMMPGTGCCALTDTVALTKAATSVTRRGVLMLPPFYYKGVSDEGLFRSYAEVIERVGDKVRIYLYNIPPVSQIPLSVALIARLIDKYPNNVVGIKDSSGDWNNTKAYLDNFASAGFEVFPGAETFLLQGLRNGGFGCISATANVNPGPIAQLMKNCESPSADEDQAKLDVIRKIFATYPMIPALKAAVAHYADDPSWATVRPPLVELTPAQKQSFINELHAVGFTMPGLQSRTA